MRFGNLVDLEKAEMSQFTEALSEYRRELSPKNGIDFSSFINPKSVYLPQDLAKLSDNEIIEEIKSGNMKAFRVLDNRHREDLLRFARNVMRNFNFRDGSEAAKDVVQDTVTKFLEILSENKFREGSDVKNYFMGAIYRNSQNYIRENNLKKVPEFIGNLEKNENSKKINIENIIDNDQDRFTRVVDSADIGLIIKVLDKMSENLRAVLMLKLVENNSHKEVAQKLSFSERSSKRLYMDGKKVLKNKIEAEIF